MPEPAKYAAALWLCAGLCGAAVAYQLKSRRALDWFGMEVTREKSPTLYWTYVLIFVATAVALSAVAAALYVG